MGLNSRLIINYFGIKDEPGNILNLAQTGNLVSVGLVWCKMTGGLVSFSEFHMLNF